MAVDAKTLKRIGTTSSKLTDVLRGLRQLPAEEGATLLRGLDKASATITAATLKYSAARESLQLAIRVKTQARLLLYHLSHFLLAAVTAERGEAPVAASLAKGDLQAFCDAMQPLVTGRSRTVWAGELAVRRRKYAEASSEMAERLKVTESAEKTLRDAMGAQRYLMLQSLALLRFRGLIVPKRPSRRPQKPKPQAPAKDVAAPAVDSANKEVVKVA